MAHDVFISYSSRDKSAADAACHFLEADGIRCWIAPRDIPPGQPWKPHIVQAIRDAGVMVLIFSGQANRSPQVKREVDIAFESGHPIVPFRIEDVQMDDEMYYCLAAAHWLDALSDPMENHLDRLLHAVRLLVSPETTGAAPPPPASPPGPISRSQPQPGVPTNGGAAAAPSGGRRWLVPAGVGGLLLVASVAFGLSRLGGESDPPPPAGSAPSGEVQGSPAAASLVDTPVSTDLPGNAAGSEAQLSGSPTTSGAGDTRAATTPSAEGTTAPVAVPSATSAPPAGTRVTDAAGDGAPAAAPANAATGVLVLIYGNEPGSAAEVETTVLRSLLQMPEVAPLDANSLGLLRGQQGAVEAANRGDFSELAVLSREHGAEFLVVGGLTANATPAVGQFFAGSAVLDLKVYRVSTGSLLGAEVLRAGTAGNLAASEDQARSRAAAEVGRSAVNTLRRWVSRANP